jgi:hypothetical protein
MSVLQDQSLVGCQPILLHATVPKALDIVIAEDHNQTIPSGEGVQQVEGAAMRALHSTEAPVLPQLITVTNLDVREPLAIVVGQCLEEQVLVLREGIGAGVVAAVQIAEKDESRAVIEEGSPGCLEGLG